MDSHLLFFLQSDGVNPKYNFNLLDWLFNYWLLNKLDFETTTIKSS